MTLILPGYNSAVKEIGLAHPPKEADPILSKSNDMDLQQSPELAKEKVIDKGRETNNSSPTLQNRTRLLQSLVELKQGAVPVPAEAYAEASESINYSLVQARNYAGNNDPKSDIEIQQQIQDIINGTQESFMNPFIDASQKMTDYYNDISTLRDTISKNVWSTGDDKGTLTITSSNYKKVQELIRQWGGAALYPTNGSGVSKVEAEDWCAKMGVGKVVSSGDQYKVVIDQTALEDILEVFEAYKTSSGGVYKEYQISQTAYNNLMSSLDTFLQKEQGKMNKIVNQLDYYNKLIAQLQERLTDFSKQMADIALNFLRV